MNARRQLHKRWRGIRFLGSGFNGIHRTCVQGKKLCESNARACLGKSDGARTGVSFHSTADDANGLSECAEFVGSGLRSLVPSLRFIRTQMLKLLGILLIFEESGLHSG